MGLEGKSPPMAAECQIDLAHRDVVHVEGHGGGSIPRRRLDGRAEEAVLVHGRDEMK